MKKTMFAIMFCASAALAETQISNLLVHQRWPWSRLTDIRYTLTTDAPVDVTVEAFRGNTSLGILPQACLTGDKYGITAGSHSIVLNPAKSGLSSYGAIADFRVRLHTAVSDAAMTNTLYMIVDLTAKSNVTYLTQGDILGGKYGSCETNFGAIGSGFNTSLSNVIIWTGVTNNSAYALDKLVLRKIPAGTFTMNGATVHLTNDYWIGVFECTQKQWQHVMGMQAAVYFCYTEWEQRPVEATPVAYVNLREATNQSLLACAAYGWPTNSTPENLVVNPYSFMGKLRALTGLEFDLPTEAQWQRACLAGTTEATLYNGLTKGIESLARYQYNGGFLSSNKADGTIQYYFPWGEVGSRLGLTNGTAAVGSYLPNAYGLYDMYGNVWEYCLDVFGPLPTGEVSNPLGENSGTNRVRRGASWGSVPSSTSRSSFYCQKGDSNNGLRLAIPFPKRE